MRNFVVKNDFNRGGGHRVRTKYCRKGYDVWDEMEPPK